MYDKQAIREVTFEGFIFLIGYLYFVSYFR